MNNPIYVLIVIFIITIILDYLLVSRWVVYKKRIKEKNLQVTVDKKKLLRLVFFEEPIEKWRNSWFRKFITPYFELFLLALWAMYIGFDYLDLDPFRIPLGRELGSSIPANHLWNQIIKCGWCAMWNGFQRGGYPAFADIQGSMLHPVVILTTLLFGVVNGVKVTIVISFWMAGIAQWWIAHELKLSWIPRMWSSGIAIAGGHLAGRMDLGVYGVVLSTAACSLVIAALIRLAKNNSRKNALILGVCVALAAVAGQGYIQIGLLSIFPIFIIFYWGKGNIKSVWLNYFIAAGIAFLLAAPFLIPFLHFSPNISKWFDANFESAQPLSYFILNLVIDNPRYFFSNVMEKFPYPYLYTLYIGWIPVILFIFAIGKISSEDKKLIYFMLTGILLEFLIASAILLKWLVGIFPFLAGIRHSPQIAGLAIPLILGISAYGLEKMLSVRKFQIQSIFPTLYQNWGIQMIWLIAIPLIYSLHSSAEFANYWTGTVKLREDIFVTLEKLETPDLQWVNPPFGEHAYIELAISKGLKLSPGILTWTWKYRIPPQPYRTADRNTSIDTETLINNNIVYSQHNQNIYAFIETTDKQTVKCEAKGSGGQIEVYCDSKQSGILNVQEYMWKGWYAWVDEVKTQLIGETYLQVSAPAGKHTFIFKYLPWDVPLGLILLLFGILSYIWLWISAEKQIEY